MCIAYLWESQKERDHQEDQRCMRVDNFKMDLGKIGWGDMDCIVWLRIGTSGGLL
jgi:hypothetical protein